MLTEFSNEESSSMVYPGRRIGLFDQFPSIASSIKSTSSQNVKISTKGTYEQHISKTFGWLTFLHSFNQKFGTELTDLPTAENYENYTELLILYFELRTKKGFDPAIGIKVTKTNEPLDAGTGWVCYSAIADFFKINGFLGNHHLNPLKNPIFEYYINGWKGAANAARKKNKRHGSKPLFYDDLVKIMNIVPSMFSSDVALWLMTMFSLCYSCFFRINELLALKMDDVALKKDNDAIPFIEITLWDRKTDLDEPHLFQVYNNPAEPAMNSFFFLCEYIIYLKKLGLYGKEYTLENVQDNSQPYFFGRYSYHKMKFSNVQCSSQSFTELLRQVLCKIGLNAVDYSAHTFRKGGARHKFLHSKVRWNLDTIMVWCGWSHSEDNHILWTYLAECEKGQKNRNAMMAMKMGTLAPTLEDMHNSQMAAIQNVQTVLSDLQVFIFNTE